MTTGGDTLHATCIAIHGRGVLLVGRPGAGKSDLALRLIDRGAMLVADDRAAIRIEGGRAIGSAPATIVGKMEVRGIGIVAVPFAAEAPLALVVDLEAPPERMPSDPAATRDVAGLPLPVVTLAPFEASAPLKVEHALARWGLPA